MKKRIFIFLGILFSLTTMLAQEVVKAEQTENYIKRMALFEKQPIGKDKIVFFGNSLTQNGKWEEYFPSQNPVNRGIAGDNTEGMLARIGEIAKAKPKKLFVMGGINDISQNKTNEVIASNIECIVKEVLKKSSKTKIYIQSVLPINNSFKRYTRLTNKESQIESLNKDLKTLCTKYKITFINLYPVFLNKKQTLDSKYTNDGLHLNSDGYAVWVNQIQKYVQ